MKKYLFLIAGIALIVGTPFVSALMLESGETVSPDTKVEGDAYLAGDKVNIQNPIQGDAIIAGGSINIDATVTQDLIIAGENVIINQEIGDDVRVAASTLTIKNNVQGDVIVFAETLNIDKNVTISGDIIAFVSKFQLDGTVNGNIKIASTSTNITGKVLKDTKIQTADFTLTGILAGKTEFTATKTAQISETARFENTVNYGYIQTLDLTPNLAEGVTSKLDPALLESQQRNQDIVKRLFSFMLVFRLFSASLVIGLLFIFFRKFVQKAVQKLNTKADAYRALGYGAILYLAPILLALIFAITIIGLPIALFIMVSYMFLLFFSQSIASFIVSQWLHTKHQFGQTQIQVYMIALGIYIVLYLLNSLPILGGLIRLLILYIALGTIIIELRPKK